MLESAWARPPSTGLPHGATASGSRAPISSAAKRWSGLWNEIDFSAINGNFDPPTRASNRFVKDQWIRGVWDLKIRLEQEAQDQTRGSPGAYRGSHPDPAKRNPCHVPGAGWSFRPLFWVRTPSGRPRPDFASTRGCTAITAASSSDRWTV